MLLVFVVCRVFVLFVVCGSLFALGRCVLFVVCRLLSAVCCSLFVLCGLLFLPPCFLIVVCWFDVCCLRCAVWWFGVLSRFVYAVVVCWLLCGVLCLLIVVFRACHVLCVVCCMLFVVSL